MAVWFGTKHVSAVLAEFNNSFEKKTMCFLFFEKIKILLLIHIYYNSYLKILFIFQLLICNPCGLGDQNSANVCPCTCRKRRLIIGYKLSYTTGLLYAWSSCMQYVVWVWTVGHSVVLVQVIYCSKGRWVLFLTRTNGIPERRSWVTSTVVSPIFP